jgi:hypothetical protein
LKLSTPRARAAAAAALALPILILCSPFLFSSQSLAGRDFQAGYGPLFEFARDSWQRDGELPRWNPFQFAGVPFVGNPQTGLSYPPNGLFLLVSVQRAFEFLVFIHLLLAASGFYRLIRGFGVRRDAAVLGALSYTLSTALLARIDAGHYPYFVTICLAPFLLHAVRLTIDRPTARHAAGLAAATAAVLLGGSPQFIFHLALFAGALAGWRLYSAARETRSWRPAAALAAGLAAGLCLSAIHLLPALQMAAESSRNEGSADELRALTEPFGEFNLSYTVAFLVPYFPWKQSANLWLSHEKALYAGVLSLVLAVAAFRRFPRGPTWFFGATFLLALLAAFGGFSPVHQLLSLLPGYSRFRVPERVLWITVLSLCALAALGWDALIRQPLESRQRTTFLRAGILLGALTTALLLLATWAPGETAIFAITLAGAFVVVAWAPRPALGPVAAVVLLTADLCGHGLGLLRLLPSGAALPKPAYARFIGSDRDRFRILDLTDYRVAPGAPEFHQLRIGGYPIPGRLCSYYSRAWTELTRHIETLPTGRGLRDPAILRRLNVRWIVSPGDPLVPEWRLLESIPGAKIYEDPKVVRPGAFEGTRGNFELTRPTTSRIRLRVRAESPGKIILGEMFSDGWRASRDGVAVPIDAWEDTLIALPVPAGASELELVYAPISWTMGRWISGAGVLAWLALLLWNRLRPR